jgi:hypothetical protein
MAINKQTKFLISGKKECRISFSKIIPVLWKRIQDLFLQIIPNLWKRIQDLFLQIIPDLWNSCSFLLLLSMRSMRAQEPDWQQQQQQLLLLHKPQQSTKSS